MLITVKFGGTSVGTPERIRGAAQIVADMARDGHQVVVVTSAMSGVTNSLVEVLDGFTAPVEDEGEQVGKYFLFAKQLEQKHQQAAGEAIGDAALLDEARKALYAERHDLERVLLGSHFLGELTPIGYDFAVSSGERFCVPVLAGSLKSLGIDAAPIGGYGGGIMTDNNYGNARPHAKKTRDNVRSTLLPLLEEGKVPVLPGFYGRSEQGRVATLGRGGSDYAATLIGCALDADEIVIMTDVDGIKTCDPRIVPAARGIDQMPYAIAAEMAMLGAKVLHQKSVGPAVAQSVPLRIASSFEPEKPGTRLVPPGDAPPRVWALTLVRGGFVRVDVDDSASAEDLFSRLYARIERQNIELLASAGGRTSRSLLALAAGGSLAQLIEVADEVDDGEGIHTTIEQPVAVLGVVGEQVAMQAETIGKVLASLSRCGAELLCTLYGASPNSLVAAVRADDEHLPQAMQALHTELGLD